MKVYIVYTQCRWHFIDPTLVFQKKEEAIAWCKKYKYASYREVEFK